MLPKVNTGQEKQVSATAAIRQKTKDLRKIADPRKLWPEVCKLTVASTRSLPLQQTFEESTAYAAAHVN